MQSTKRYFSRALLQRSCNLTADVQLFAQYPLLANKSQMRAEKKRHRPWDTPGGKWAKQRRDICSFARRTNILCGADYGWRTTNVENAKDTRRGLGSNVASNSIGQKTSVTLYTNVVTAEWAFASARMPSTQALKTLVQRWGRFTIVSTVNFFDWGRCDHRYQSVNTNHQKIKH